QGVGGERRCQGVLPGREQGRPAQLSRHQVLSSSQALAILACAPTDGHAMNSDERYYDDLEIRSPEAREGALLARLPELVATAVRDAPGWARQLQGVDPRSIDSRKALAKLPVLRKTE